MPLRIIDVFGVAAACIGMLMSIILIIQKLLNPHIAAGYTSIMAVLLIVSGIMMLALGLMGEYIGRMYMILSDMPQYMVRDVTSISESTLMKGEKISEEVSEAR